MTDSIQIQQLIPDVKNHLNISWSDPGTDRNVVSWIGAGIAYLDDKRGAPADYTKPSNEKTLLLEYCRYMRDSALDVFENNYRSLILGMQNRRAVSAYVEKTASEK